MRSSDNAMYALCNKYPVLYIAHMALNGFKLHMKFTGNGKLVHYDRYGNY